MVSIDLVKTYDGVLTDLIWWALDKNSVPRSSIECH